MKALPCESVTDVGVVFVSKSNATRIRSPEDVLAGNETENALAAPGVAPAATCRKVKETVALTVRVSVAVPVPAPLVALNVTDDVPDVLGVPEIKPVAVLIDNPAGKPVAPKLVGLLVAAV